MPACVQQSICWAADLCIRAAKLPPEYQGYCGHGKTTGGLKAFPHKRDAGST